MTEPVAPPDAIEITDEPTAVYRFYDARGVLLYVGISCNLPSRWAQHASEKSWWPQVAKKTVVMYGSRREAEMAESRAIRSESPIHNKTMGRKEPKPPPRRLPAILRMPPGGRSAEAIRQVRPLRESFTLSEAFLARIDAYAERFECTRDSAFGTLLLTGIITYEEESKLPPEEEMAAVERRLRAEGMVKIPA